MKTEKKIFIGIGLTTVLIIAGAALFIPANDAKQEEKKLKPFIGQKVVDMGQVHVKQGEVHAAYNSDPPTSGAHISDGVAGAGIHEKQVADELLVHSLEHGAVIVSYKTDLPKNQIEKIKNAFNAASGKKIMVPRKNLDTPVALTSWNYLLKLNTIDEKQIQTFIETNNDRAPEKAAI